jgi:hypothetical protein
MLPRRQRQVRPVRDWSMPKTEDVWDAIASA